LGRKSRGKVGRNKKNFLIDGFLLLKGLSLKLLVVKKVILDNL
jgi:hypothetical protein